jgi:hypothetical protein
MNEPVLQTSEVKFTIELSQRFISRDDRLLWTLKNDICMIRLTAWLSLIHSIVEAVSTISSDANITAPLAMNINIEKWFIFRALKQIKVQIRQSCNTPHITLWSNCHLQWNVREKFDRIMSFGLRGPKWKKIEHITKRPQEFSFSFTMALGSTQPLTEISTRNLPAGKGRPAGA